MNENITAIIEHLTYDSVTGKIHWIKSPSRKVRKGSLANNFDKNGYLQVGLKGKYYLQHRIAWFFHYGEFPKNHIDHINGDKSDNRIVNLRDATVRENCQNLQCHRDGKLVGAIKHTKNTWISRIRINGKQEVIGYFKTPTEANMAYNSKVKELNYV